MKQKVNLLKVINKKFFLFALLTLCSVVLFSACAVFDGSYGLPDEQDAYWPPYQSSEAKATRDPNAASLKNKFLGVSKISHLPNEPMTTKVTHDESEILIADLNLRFSSNGAGGDSLLVNSSQAYTIDFDNDEIDETIVYLDRIGFLIFKGEEIFDFLPFTVTNSDYFSGKESWISHKYRPEDAPIFTINYLRILDLDKSDGVYDFLVCGQVYATNVEYTDDHLTGKLPLTMLCRYDPSKAKADVDRECEWLNLERLGYVFEFEGSQFTHTTELVNILGYRSMLTTSDVTFYDAFPTEEFDTPAQSHSVVKTLWLVELTDDIPENDSLDNLSGFFAPFFKKGRFVRVLSMENGAVTLEDVHYSTITISANDFNQVAGRALRIDNELYFDKNIGYVHETPKPATLYTGTLTGSLVYSPRENDAGEFSPFCRILPIETDLKTYVVLENDEYHSKSVLFNISIDNSDYSVSLNYLNGTGEVELRTFFFGSSLLINGIHTEDVFCNIYDSRGNMIKQENMY